MYDPKFLQLTTTAVEAVPVALASTGLEVLPVFIVAFAVILVGVALVLYLGYRRRKDRGA